MSETRVGQRTDYDRLAVMVETNGTISPEDAIAYAAALATEHLRFFIDFGRVPQARSLPAEGVAITGGLRMKLERLIDDLGLSVRSLNSLKNSNIRTLRDLVQFSREELDKVKNIGDKAVAEIAELLEREGLRFGMSFEEVDGDLRVARSGGASAESPDGSEGGEHP